jgi:hypothetical protein
VDTIGNVLLAKVTAADTPEREGARLLLWEQRGVWPRLVLVWANRGHDGAALHAWVMDKLGCTLAIVRPPAGQSGFQIQQKTLDRGADMRLSIALPPTEQRLQTSDHVEQIMDLPGAHPSHAQSRGSRRSGRTA